MNTWSKSHENFEIKIINGMFFVNIELIKKIQASLLNTLQQTEESPRINLEECTDEFLESLNKIDKKFFLDAAKLAFQHGNIKLANRLIDIRVKDSNNLYNHIQELRKQVHNGIVAKHLQTKTILWDLSISLHDRIKRVVNIYEECITWAKDSALNKTEYVEILKDYLKFLEEYKDKSEGIITQEKIESIKKLFEEMKKLE